MSSLILKAEGRLLFPEVFLKPPLHSLFTFGYLFTCLFWGVTLCKIWIVLLVLLPEITLGSSQVTICDGGIEPWSAIYPLYYLTSPRIFLGFIFERVGSIALRDYSWLSALETM